MTKTQSHVARVVEQKQGRLNLLILHDKTQDNNWVDALSGLRRDISNAHDIQVAGETQNTQGMDLEALRETIMGADYILCDLRYDDKKGICAVLDAMNIPANINRPPA